MVPIIVVLAGTLFAQTIGTLYFCIDYGHLLFSGNLSVLGTHYRDPLFGHGLPAPLVRSGWTLWMQITGTLDFCITRKHRSMYVKTPRTFTAR